MKHISVVFSTTTTLGSLEHTYLCEDPSDQHMIKNDLNQALIEYARLAPELEGTRVKDILVIKDVISVHYVPETESNLTT